MSKANRFKKSLDELEAQNDVMDREVDTVNNQDINISSNILTNVLDTANSNTLTNILNNISAKEPQGKSVALYLSVEVDKAVTKIAKQKGVSKSKLVNGVLRQVLLQEK